MTRETTPTRVGAYGLILKESKILLCRLTQQVPQWAGYWTLPGGGLEFGEDPEAAMVREVAEETGLSVQPTAIAGIDSRLLTNIGPEFHGIRIVYHTSLMGGELRFEEDGSTDKAQWFSQEELTRLPMIDLAKYGIALAFGAG